MKLLEGLLSRREEPLMINAMVARHFRLLLRTRIHLYLGESGRDLAGILGVHDFVSRKLLNQCRRFTGTELSRSLARLARADLEIKSCRRPARLVVEEAVLDLSIGSQGNVI
jgi:DNA polymerase-3 subunit delta